MSQKYFNPRTPVGCDYRGPDEPAHDGLFQSTHPSGVRHDAAGSLEQCLFISIHAPQWGATLGYSNTNDAIRFQSTHPSGVRPREWA